MPAWWTSFVGYTLLCSLLGWTTRGRHHTPVSVCLTVWPLHRDFSLLFCEKGSGFFYVHRVWLSYTRDRRLNESPPKDLAMRIKRLAKGRYTAAAEFDIMRNLQYGSSRSIHWRLRPGPTAGTLLERSLNGRERGPNFDNARHRAQNGKKSKTRALP